jgi:hypothetical protein
VRGLSDAQWAAVTSAVEQLAWTVARELLELEPDVEPHSNLPDADVQQMWLAALKSLLAIQESAEQLAASAALSAAQRGADYPAIGDAAGMTRQGARRKWPGLAGLSDERQRKLAWWNRRRDQFLQCAGTVLTAGQGQPDSDWARLPDLGTRLTAIQEAPPSQRVDAFDLLLVDAHAVALGVPTPAQPKAALAIGLLAALTADAYAATNSWRSLITHDDNVCRTDGCVSSAIVELLCPHVGHLPVPACRRHAIEALRQPDNRIVTAYGAEVALSVFMEAHAEVLDE